jgi:flagellar biosynthesis protein FlhG
MNVKSPVLASISSGKGGVGKTFITVNLAACLAQRKKKVLVVDCDFGLANIDIMLGLHPKFTLRDVIFENVAVSDVLVKTEGGFDFIPASSGVNDMAQLLYENIQKIKTILTDVVDSYDYVLLDTGAGIAENVLQFNLFAHKNVIVLNRELTSLTDAYAIIKVIYQMFNRNAFHIIVNSALDEQEGKRIFDHISSICNKFLGFPLNSLGHIVYGDNVPRSIMRQEVLALSSPATLPAMNCASIADKVAAW